jgi:hypothetical protein
MCDKGQGVPQDHKEAAKWFRKAAEQGNARAQQNLGLMYYSGQGVPQDYKEAAKWFRKAAEQGNARAQYSLGLMCAKGQGVPQNYVRAYAWVNLATVELPELAEGRNIILKLMTPQQIEEAQELSVKLQKEIEQRTKKNK